MFRSPRIIGIPTACSDGKFRGRYPDGIWTPPGAQLAGDAAARAAASAVLLAGGSGTGVGSITPTGMTDRPAASPMKSVFMESSTEGGNYVDAGFDYIYNTAMVSGVRKTQGPGGGPAWYSRQQGDINNFLHIGNNLAAGMTSEYGSMWLKLAKVSGAGGPMGQLKGPRSGNSTDSDPANKYAGPGFSVSGQWYDTRTFPSLAQIVGKVHNPSESVCPDEMMNWDQPTLFDGNWHYLEWRYLWAASGANSRSRFWVDGVSCYDWTGINLNQAGEFRFITWCPGLTNDFAAAIEDLWLSHMYVDKAGPQIFRMNASTLVAATKKWQLRPVAPFTGSAWGYDGDLNAPAGLDWVCTIDSAGNSYVEYRPL